MEAPTTNRILPPGTVFAPALLPGRGGFYAGIHGGLNDRRVKGSLLPFTCMGIISQYYVDFNLKSQ